MLLEWVANKTETRPELPDFLKPSSSKKGKSISTECSKPKKVVTPAGCCQLTALHIQGKPTAQNNILVCCPLPRPHTMHGQSIGPDVLHDLLMVSHWVVAGSAVSGETGSQEPKCFSRTYSTLVCWQCFHSACPVPMQRSQHGNSQTSRRKQVCSMPSLSPPS